MKISDLKPSASVDNIEVTIIEKSEPREFTSRYGASGRVCDAKCQDDTGEVKLTLWNDEIEKVNVDNKIRVTNGYVKEWNGELQLTAGKYGKMEVIE